jgi:FkbM family methyltransferase
LFVWQGIIPFFCPRAQGFVICPTLYDTNLLVNTSDFIGDAVYKTGLYEPGIIWFLKEHLHKGDIFCDIGAYIGDTACIASRFVGDEGYVYAFEPSLDNYKMLYENIRRNNLRNVKSFRIALGSEKSVANISIRTSLNRGADSLVPKKIEDKSCEITSVTSIDLLVENQDMKIPNLIKIDVEGYELEVLKGARNLLKSKQAPILSLEYIRSFSRVGYNVKEIYEFIKNVNDYYIYEFKKGIRIKEYELREIKKEKDIKTTNIFCFPYKL